MGFADVATEIRLKIYSELLILSTPIEFRAGFGLPSRLFRSSMDGLCPAILRVCRTVYDEAIPLLYSSNRFQFPEIYDVTRSVPAHAHVAPFLVQIGLQAKLIHHICIPFPVFDYPVPERARLDEVHTENLELIRKTCTNIKTLELLVPVEHRNYALGDSAIASDALDLLNTRLKTIRSLKEIVIDFEEYPEDDPSDDLTKKKMADIGWIVRITRLPKRVWSSIDDRVEFDNEEDCIAYNNEYLRREQEMEEEREEEEWLDEYYRRRRDPYWKNDSDYD